MTLLLNALHLWVLSGKQIFIGIVCEIKMIKRRQKW